MPKYFCVRDYEKYQHYKNRTPPWIKLYNRILDDDDFEDLPDTTKYHFLAITLLASRTNNKMKYDPAYIKRKISAKTNVNLNLLRKSGFIDLIAGEDTDSNALAERYQDASTEREGEKRRKEGEKNREDAKISYAENVTLTEKEYQKLIADYGASKTKQFIETLENYKGAPGKKNESDYRTIPSWEVEKDGSNGSSSHKANENDNQDAAKACYEKYVKTTGECPEPLPGNDICKHCNHEKRDGSCQCRECTMSPEENKARLKNLTTEIRRKAT